MASIVSKGKNRFMLLGISIFLLSYLTNLPRVSSLSLSPTSAVSSNPIPTSFLLKVNDEKKEEINKDRFRNEKHSNPSHLQFDYEYSKLSLLFSSPENNKQDVNTNIILLIHPIGVGIGRWYYNRLLNEISTSFQILNTTSIETTQQLIVLAPDLLGCGSACNPRLVTINNDNDDINEDSMTMKKLPLLTVNDWADQLIDFMIEYEEGFKEKIKSNQNHNINWTIVSNGGCVPISLEIAKRFIQAREKDDRTIIGKISQINNLILSATPSAQSLLSEPEPDKIRRSYKILSGIPGNLFWWNALRSNGKFIQKFSEKNLASKAENLGDAWTPTCVETAKAFQSRSRFSTFAFLAGSLNGGNNERLESLAGKIRINVITGNDVRRNPARSWFWEKQSKNSEEDDEMLVAETTLVPILQRNGNGGVEYFVGGRRCPAHEDAIGFCEVLLDIVFDC
jgi:hypothetical protein